MIVVIGMLVYISKESFQALRCFTRLVKSQFFTVRICLPHAQDQALRIFAATLYCWRPSLQLQADDLTTLVHDRVVEDSCELTN
jgi:hypothetical protein